MSLQCLQVECVPKHSPVKVFPSIIRKRLATFGRVKEIMQLCQMLLSYILINQPDKNIITRYIILQIWRKCFLKFSIKKCISFLCLSMLSPCFVIALSFKSPVLIAAVIFVLKCLIVLMSVTSSHD